MEATHGTYKNRIRVIIEKMGESPYFSKLVDSKREWWNW